MTIPVVDLLLKQYGQLFLGHPPSGGEVDRSVDELVLVRPPVAGRGAVGLQGQVLDLVDDLVKRLVVVGRQAVVERVEGSPVLTELSLLLLGKDLEQPKRRIFK